jgi:hypothetical protein
MSAATLAQWAEAIRDLKHKRSRAFVNLWEAHGPPPAETHEKFLNVLRGLEKTPSQHVIDLTNGLEEFPALETQHGYKKAVVLVCTKYGIKKPSVFENVLRKNRQDVNDELKRRRESTKFGDL